MRAFYFACGKNTLPQIAQITQKENTFYVYELIKLQGCPSV